MPDFSAESSANRNVLLGLLACKLHFVTREQLVAAFRVWLADKARLLESIFVEQGALNDERRTLLVALVENYLAQHDGDLARSLADLSSLGSVPEELRALADPNITASLSRIIVSATADPFRTRKPDAGDPAGAAQGSSTANNPRFRILRPLARGGMGQVSVALDEELGREVALKEIQERTAHEADTRDRFVREAEITGQLEHPGVVPVYGLGTYADGRPYYAMRFIRGDNLLAHITRFHERGPEFQSREFRQLLGRFIDVCQAIAYAHARRVLHRDLKPANIVLGNYGETLVVDWGLAKAAGTGEPGRTPDGEAFVQLYRSGSTATEDRLGTPAYMSPEQAAGKIQELDHTTDIYSLGATLYCLLTGQPPATRGGLHEVLQNVQQGNIRPPRTVQPKIPVPLAAICQKAMAHAPSERYPTALDLATEIENWLADNPVTAHRESFFARSARWIRKHPVVTSTVGSSLLLLAVAATVIAGVSAEYSRELGVKNTKLAENEKQLTKTNSDLNLSIQNEREYATLAKSEAFRARGALLSLQRRFAAEAESHPDEAARVLFDTRYSPLEWRDLSWRVAARDLERLEREERLNGAVSRVRFNPTNQGFAFGTNKGELQIYHQRFDSEPHKIKPSESFVWDLAYSRDGRRIAVAYGDYLMPTSPGHVLVFDVDSGELVNRLEGFAARMRAVAFSPDDSLLAVGGDDRLIHVYATDYWEPIRVLRGHRIGIARLSFFDDTTLVAAAADNHTPIAGKLSDLFVWNLAAAERPTVIKAGSEPFRVAALNPVRQIVATVGDKGIVRVWKVPSGKLHSEFAERDGKVFNMDYSQSGDYLTISWSANSLEPGERYDGIVSLHYRDESVPRLALRAHSVASFSSATNDEKLVTTGVDATVRWWNLNAGIRTAVLPVGTREIRAFAVTPSRDLLAAATAIDPGAADKAAEIVVWDLKKGIEFKRWKAHADQIEALAFSPDGSRLASGAQDNLVIIWDTATGQLLNTLAGHSSMVSSVVFSPDGNYVGSGSEDGTVRWWNWADQKSLAVMSNHAGEVGGIDLSPSGDLLASSDTQGVVRLWNPKGGSLIAELRGQVGLTEAPLWLVKFSPDGSLLATGGVDHEVLVWDVRKRAVQHRFRGHTGIVYGLSFTSDNRMLISSDLEGRILFWDLENGIERAMLEPTFGGIAALELAPAESGLLCTDFAGNVRWIHIGGRSVETKFRAGDDYPVTDLQFTPDGDRFITVGADRTFRVWNSQDCRVLNSWNVVRSGMPTAAEVSNAGDLAATADDQRTVKIWSLGDGKLVQEFAIARQKSLFEKAMEGIFSMPPAGQFHELIQCMDFSPNDQHLAFTLNDKVIRVFDVRSGKQVQSLPANKSPILAVRYLSDYRLVSGDTDGNVVLWDLKAGRSMKMHPFAGQVRAIDATSVGGQIAVGLAVDNGGEVWAIDSNLSNPQLIRTRDSFVNGLSLSKDGRRLATAYIDFTIDVADFPSGSNATVLRKSFLEGGVVIRSPILSNVAISPTGRSVISGDPGSEMRRWQQHPDGAWTDYLPPKSLFPELHAK